MLREQRLTRHLRKPSAVPLFSIIAVSTPCGIDKAIGGTFARLRERQVEPHVLTCAPHIVGVRPTVRFRKRKRAPRLSAEATSAAATARLCSVAGVRTAASFSSEQRSAFARAGAATKRTRKKGANLSAARAALAAILAAEHADADAASGESDEYNKDNDDDGSVGDDATDDDAGDGDDADNGAAALARHYREQAKADAAKSLHGRNKSHRVRPCCTRRS